MVCHIIHQRRPNDVQEGMNKIYDTELGNRISQIAKVILETLKKELMTNSARETAFPELDSVTRAYSSISFSSFIFSHIIACGRV